MDSALIIQLQDAAVDVVRTIEAPTPIAAGKLLNFSDYRATMYDREIKYTSFGFLANFKVHHRSPFVPSKSGTVNLTEQPRIVRQPIHIHTCDVEMDAITMKSWDHMGIIDLYKEQLAAKIIAWDQFVENALIYGIPSLNIPGMVQGSGIPIYSEPTNFSTASPQVMLAVMLSLLNSVAINSKMRFTPSKIGMPLGLFDLLNKTTISSNDSRSVLTVLRERLAEGFGTGVSQAREIIAVPSLDAIRMMAILDTDTTNVGACVFNLEETGSGTASGNYNSRHVAGIAGVVCRRPQSSLLVRVIY